MTQNLISAIFTEVDAAEVQQNLLTAKIKTDFLSKACKPMMFQSTLSWATKTKLPSGIYFKAIAHTKL